MNPTIQDLKYMSQYTDDELIQMEFNAITKERDSWRRNFEELKIKYEELQNLFVQTDDELNEYREKFVNEAIQHEYLKNDYEYILRDIGELKARLSVVEATIRETNRSTP